MADGNEVTLTNNQTMAQPMIIPWLRGTHSEMEGYDVHLSRLREQDSSKGVDSNTYPNQKNAAA